MAIKNISLYLVNISFILLLSSCQSLGLKSKHVKQGKTGEPVEMVEQEANVKAETPEFLQKQAPKLGIILGPGGALTYAQIGFLQELENNKVKVHSIAGIEWGALVAATYAQEGKANAIEWKLLKLPIEKFDNSGFFTSNSKGVSVKAFDSYLSETFGRSNLSDMDIPFTCPFINVGKAKSGIRRSGRVHHVVRSCWPLPPHFKIDQVGANPMGVADIARRLKQQGAELIVYVDVIAENSVLSSKQRKTDPTNALYWLANASIHSSLGKPLVDEVVLLPVSGSDMTSYKSLRTIIRSGQVKSSSIVKGLAKKYAY